jgi:hypothetical protein
LFLSTPNRYSSSREGLARYVRDGTVWNARDETHVRLSAAAALKTVGAVLEVERCLGYTRARPGHATGWTHVVAENPIAAGLCHKLPWSRAARNRHRGEAHACRAAALAPAAPIVPPCARRGSHGTHTHWHHPLFDGF